MVTVASDSVTQNLVYPETGAEALLCLWEEEKNEGADVMKSGGRYDKEGAFSKLGNDGNI